MSRLTDKHDQAVLRALSSCDDGEAMTRAEIQRASRLSEHDLGRALRRLVDTCAITVHQGTPRLYALTKGGQGA